MATVFVTDRDALEMIIDIRPGTSLMQAITDEGIGDLLALCGGMCSCATCHVYIDEKFLGQISAMSDDEQGLLEMSSYRKENSRLACQVRMSDSLDGMRATIAPAD
ncbi:2Fe-2S iron-sulfur cluster binding domain-containing protein [Aestuariicella hydrocarbonica]|uniref:2Fe-2S iron-sulfur cluster binding domain-containing protein n=1 Tax=Pseudomaricurvus hydrocarbonicus TaxID=1470433 RepID=A0A9E5T3L0_9GAMM|nr:2Fe-2S iron-sulfur cluster-binding protein [Aestuariicella hydrocarbonica]NHO67084.1 2Fe-2S iron-sulfur cluster binding domain-containing protein [Aestuariicella hydrocarbonica]